MRSTVLAIALSLALFQSCSADGASHEKRILGFGAPPPGAGALGGTNCLNSEGFLVLELLNSGTCVTSGSGAAPMTCANSGGTLAVGALNSVNCISTKSADSNTQDNNN